jgi:hypothetical protein
MNQPTFETNIGTVLILKDSIRPDGKHYIEFKGSGYPKGPLAERMNWSKRIAVTKRRTPQGGFSGGNYKPKIARGKEDHFVEFPETFKPLRTFRERKTFPH